MKVPYSANYYTEAEFWNLYDREKYNTLRKKWHAEALPSMHDKVRRRQVDENEEDRPVPVPTH
jgi:delta24-sterol reductase